MYSIISHTGAIKVAVTFVELSGVRGLCLLCAFYDFSPSHGRFMNANH